MKEDIQFDDFTVRHILLLSPSNLVYTCNLPNQMVPMFGQIKLVLGVGTSGPADGIIVSPTKLSVKPKVNNPYFAGVLVEK